VSKVEKREMLINKKKVKMRREKKKRRTYLARLQEDK
jgi:hypothetical protein